MPEKTVESVVAHLTKLKSISLPMYVGTINQILNLIEGNDYDNIAQHYPGKDISFFIAVLKELGELD